MDKKTTTRSATARKILEAAVLCFSESGFDGARMEEVARLAGVNKAAIYYHLGGKEALYEQVMHEIFSNLADRVVASAAVAASPMDKLAAYIGAVWQLPQMHPHMPPMMMREIASGGKNLPGVVITEMARIIACLASILEQGVRENSFNPIPVMVVHFMIVGPLMFFNRLQPVLEQNAGTYPDIKYDPDLSTHIMQHVRTVLLTAFSCSSKTYHQTMEAYPS